jgi:hypothetical protein
MSDPQPPATVPPSPKNAWFAGSRVVWVVAILAAFGILVFFGILWAGRRTLDTADKGVETVGKAIETAERVVVGIAEAFRPETISKTFVEYTELSVKGNEGNILEVATAEAKENFSRTTNLVWFDRVVPVGTTVSEIIVPATYRFHIDLKGPWDIAAYDGRVTVIAPPIQPSLPVAFDTGGMQKKTKSGWGRWDGDASLKELENSLTSRLGERAVSAAVLDRVREPSRLAVAHFVKNWLVTGKHWGESTYREIVVVFPDEIGSAGADSLSIRPATLRWEAPDRASEAVLP